MVYIQSRAQRAFFDALREYQKAYRRFSKAQPTTAEAEDAFDEALDHLIDTLEDPDVQLALNCSLESLEDESAIEQGIADKLLSNTHDAKFERSLASNFGMSTQAVKRIGKFLQGVNPAECELNQDELTSALERVHESAKTKINNARELPRKKKKKRKRDVKRGLYSATFGSGILVANTVAGPSFYFSYGIACVAIHQAGRDFIGDN